MAVAIFTGEKRISEIATRVFGDLPPGQLRVAEEALLNANPHLKALRTLKPGAVIMVPPVAGLKPKQAASASEQPTAAAVTAVARSLEQYQKQLAEAITTDQEGVKSTTTRLKSRELKGLATKFKLEAQLAAIEQANKARDEAAKEAETFATKTIAEIQEDLKDLITKLGD
jgi:hypothetical protein